MKRRIFRTAAGIGLVFALMAAPDARSQNAMGLEEFHSLLKAWAQALEAQGGDVTIGGKPLSELIKELNDEQLDLLYDAFADKEQLQEAIEGLTPAEPQPQQSLGPQSRQSLGILALSQGAFPPAYPNPNTEPSYAAVLNPLVANALNPLSDTNNDGNFFDERCSAEYESATWISLTTAQTADNFVGLLCDADLEPISRGICFGAAVVTLGGVLATEILVGQCALQDALVDSAEIEAGYENTVSLLSNLDQHDMEVQAKLDSIEGKVDTALVYLLNTVRLLHTPNGRRSSDVPACNGGPCTWNFK